jgi:chromosome segregation ATPase
MLQCDEPGCTNPADFTYRWPWGAEGARCSQHEPGLRQHAERLNREVTIVPLHAPAPPEAHTLATLTAENESLRRALEQAMLANDDQKEQLSALHNRQAPLERELEECRRLLADCQQRNAQLTGVPLP